MSEALCQCGHAQNMHTEFMPQNGCRGKHVSDNGEHSWGCTCLTFTPPPTREPIRLTDEAEAAYHREFRGPTLDPVLAEREKECFVAGFRAARLAGGPTLADVRTPIAQEIEATVWRDGHGKPCTPFDEGKAAAARIARGNYIADARTPESEDTE